MAHSSKKRPVHAQVAIHGYAIVSDNDCIADAKRGRTPDVLRNDADWAYFQAELNKSAVTVLGRLGHEANPNPKRPPADDPVLVLSRARASRGRLVVEPRGSCRGTRPSAPCCRRAGASLCPAGGGSSTSSSIGYDAFHLTRAEGTLVPNGVTVFSGCREGGAPRPCCRRRGLRADDRRSSILPDP